MCVRGEGVGGNGPFARKVYVSVGAGKAVQGEVGEKARQCRGSALGKEGRKYGVGMGKNCPFMHETTALKPTMDGVGMGKNCPFMHETTALKPTMAGVGMGENCPFMHETTALKPTMAGVGMGKNCPFMHETTALKPTMDGVGEGKNCPFMHGKRLLYPTNYWAEVPDTCAVGVSAGNWGCAWIW